VTVAELKGVVETLYGKYYKFEVVRRTTWLGDYRFDVYRDGASVKTEFHSLSDAIDWVKKQG
jgi:hypothetical protein